MLWLGLWEKSEPEKKMLVMMPSAQCCCVDHAGCRDVNCCPSETVISRKMMSQLECRYTGMPKMRKSRKPPESWPGRVGLVASEGGAPGWSWSGEGVVALGIE